MVIVEALAAEARALETALGDLPESGFGRPTGCEPWTVKELLAHLLVACRRVPGMLTGPAPARAEVSALAYFHGDKLGGAFDEERIAAAQRDAASFSSGRDLVDAVVAAVEETAARASEEPADRLVYTRWGEPMYLIEYLETRVFELAVHGLDLALALGRDAWMTRAAAAVTVGVLCEGGARPRVDWDDVTFIATATGRRPVTDDELSAARAAVLWPRTS